MSKHKCELCGTPVKVVGKTTKHYEQIRPATSVVSGSKLAEIIEDELQTNCLKSLLDIGENPNYYKATQILARSVYALLTEGKGDRCKHGVWAADHCYQCEKEGKVNEPKWPLECKASVLETGDHRAYWYNLGRADAIKAWKDAQ